MPTLRKVSNWQLGTSAPLFPEQTEGGAPAASVDDNDAAAAATTVHELTWVEM